MMCTADQVVKFFAYSPKKQTVHEKLIDETANDETSRTKLKQLCRTRWVERHDAFSVFLDFFPAIVQTLEHFANCQTHVHQEQLMQLFCYILFAILSLSSLLLLCKCAWLL